MKGFITYVTGKPSQAGPKWLERAREGDGFWVFTVVGRGPVLAQPGVRASGLNLLLVSIRSDKALLSSFPLLGIPLFYFLLFFHLHPRICLLIWERERSMWKRYFDQLLPIHTPGDRTHSLGMCPDWESNPQTFGVWNNSPTNWTTRQGQVCLCFR